MHKKISFIIFIFLFSGLCLPVFSQNLKERKAVVKLTTERKKIRGSITFLSDSSVQIFTKTGLVNVPIQDIKKIGIRRRYTKLVWIPVSMAATTAGATYTLNRFGNSWGSGAITTGAMAGYFVGIPLGIIIANTFKKRYIIRGSTEKYKALKPTITRYLSK